MGNCIAVKKKSVDEPAGQLYLDTVQQELNKKKEVVDMESVEQTPQPLQQTQGIIIKIPQATVSKLNTKNFTYEGNLINDLFCGNGMVVFADGVEYEGKFFEGRANGPGKYTNPATGVTYYGKWSDGSLEGEVQQKLGDTLIFEGQYSMGKRNGKGKFMSNGASYEGDFVDGLFHGIGKAKWVDGGYDGEWVRGLRSGRGRGYGVGWSYEGEWYAGKMDGYGRMMTDRVEKAGFWENDIYIGEFYENQ